MSHLSLHLLHMCTSKKDSTERNSVQFHFSLNIKQLRNHRILHRNLLKNDYQKRVILENDVRKDKQYVFCSKARTKC